MISCILGRHKGHKSDAAIGEKPLGFRDGAVAVPKETTTLSTLATRFLLAALVAVVVSGCGRYKQDLEEARQRIDSLTADNKKHSEIIAGLEKDKGRLTEERQAADTRIDTLLKELGDLKKANGALSDEISKLKKKNSELSADLNSVGREKTDLSQQIEQLKSRAAESARPVQPPPVGRGESEPQPGAEARMPKAPENMSPCEAVLAFMNASEQVVKSYKGKQRTDMLEKVKQEYGPRMKGAPEKARRNAQGWVDELSKSWDKPGDNTVFNLVTKKNAIHDACAKKPGDAGR